jgi:hypothetical protein
LGLNQTVVWAAEMTKTVPILATLYHKRQFQVWLINCAIESLSNEDKFGLSRYFFSKVTRPPLQKQMTCIFLLRVVSTSGINDSKSCIYMTKLFLNFVSLNLNDINQQPQSQESLVLKLE